MYVNVCMYIMHVPLYLGTANETYSDSENETLTGESMEAMGTHVNVYVYTHVYLCMSGGAGGAARAMQLQHVPCNCSTCHATASCAMQLDIQMEG
jgi:hypothetical protein